MIINRRENITKNILCDDIYKILGEELGEIATGKVGATDNTENDRKKNPFVEQSSEQESVDTFVPIGSLKTHIKEKARVVFGGASQGELGMLIELVDYIRNKTYGNKTMFCSNTEDFFVFLKAFAIKRDGNVTPIEGIVQLIDINKDRAAVQPLALKYFRIIFLMQKPIFPSYYEISIMYNLMKMDFLGDPYAKHIVELINRAFILGIMHKYVSNVLIRPTRVQIREFSEILEITMNAFNGTIAELEVEIRDVTKVIYVMLCFSLNRDRSEFQKKYGVRELFYCAVRAVHQGRQFAKRLECFIFTKLRWKMKADDEEFTCDKIYQTLFKSEYKQFVGKLRIRDMGHIKYSENSLELSSSTSTSEESQRVLITKIVHTTPKMDKSKEKYAFSPLSRRIGESLPDRDSLDSKRKLKFDE